MPVYEYLCSKCSKKFTISLSYQEYDNAKPACSFCGSDQVQRKIGRIRVAHGDDSRMDQYADTPLNAMESDPQGMARMMRKMSQESGEPMPAEFNEVVGRLEKGEKPADIEKSMPNLGSTPGDV